ncbi:hypothetical protein [Rhodococcus sp. KRD175]|uniref:hypothetical protein n=1 Tax=Rhodococcus sp. KRD175 TaxID=2729729 RepID=UPI0019D02CB5|nr:hypothetical protein [Rhodococcus sp. KRD175]
MLTTAFDAVHTTILAIPQPDAVTPPGGDKIWKGVGVILWILTIGALVGVMLGGGMMGFDHLNGQGAMGGKGIKVLLGSLIGALIMSIAASLVTFAMS